MNQRTWLVVVLVVAMVGAIFAVPGSPVAQSAKAQAAPFILNVGVQDEMKTRNLIRYGYFTSDVWTADVLNPVLEGTVQTHPETQDVLPYVMLGTDVNGNGVFDNNEIGVFAPTQQDPNVWVAFYDVNGMKFHDGTQVQMEDVLIGYHLEGLSPVSGSARFSKDCAGCATTNYTSTRWLFINPTPIATGGWLGGNAATGQFALRFKQTGPNAQFNRDTLQTTIMPAYFWQGTGVRKLNGNIVAQNIHPNFGWALNPDSGQTGATYLNAVPTAGITTTQQVTFEGITINSGTNLAAFAITPASNWDAQDGDVIGSGAFKFTTWVQGSFARIDRNPDYFQPDTTIAAATYAAGLRVPKLDAMVYRLYKNVQASIFALQTGTIDFTDWNVPPDFVSPLLSDPNVGLKTSADAGFFYLSYNFRRLPWGYTDPAQGSNLPGNDVGLAFRQAVAMASDKRTIVTNLLQNFGVPGHTVVSPTNTLYYNDSAPRYPYDLTQARAVLDAAYGVWPGGTCSQDGTGCRDLPGKHRNLIEILTPQADYDPIRAAAGTLIAQNLRSIGVNINAKPTAFGEISTSVFDEQNFDMWILGWSLTGYIVPSYIFDFFHKLNVILGGDNAEGYVSDALSTIIDDAIAAPPGSPEAVRLWKWAQSIIADDQAYNVLYFRTNIFAFRQDRIDPSSWRTDIGGDVFFYWSWILLDPAPPGLITASASAPSAVGSGATVTVTATVRDPDLQRLAGATVDFTVTGGGVLAPATGTTDSQGVATTTFTAPTLISSDTPVSSIIQVRATDPNFGAANPVNVVITTFPPGQKFLNLLVDLPFGNVVSGGGTTVLDISVTDETQLAASGADVLLSVTPADPTLSVTTFTTDATGHRQVTFGAPTVTTDKTYTVSVNADRNNVSGATTVKITVLYVAPVTPPGGGSELLLIVGAVVGVGAAGGGYLFVRSRRKK